MSFDDILGDLALAVRRRDLRLPVPRRLEASIIAKLPATNATATGFPAAPGFVAGIVAIGTAGALLIGLSQHRSPKVPALAPTASAPPVATEVTREKASILAAVDQQNCWHLSEHSRRLRGNSSTVLEASWEEWGRRWPYFYRNDISGETIIDDGKTVRHIIPPQTAGGIKASSASMPFQPGRVIIRRSAGLHFRSMDHSGFLTTDPNHTTLPSNFEIPSMTATGWGTGAGSSERLVTPSSAESKNPDAVTFEMIDVLKGFGHDSDDNFARRLVVSRTSHLPSRYSESWTRTNSPAVDKNGNAAPFQSEEIRADYSRDLPELITKPGVPAGYATIDLTTIDSVSAVAVAPGAGKNAAVTLRPELTARDLSGIIAMRLNVEFARRMKLLQTIPTKLEDYTLKDDAGNVYVWTAARSADPLVPTLLVAAADPDKARATHPTHIVIQCNAILSGKDAGSEMSGGPDTRVRVIGTLDMGGNPVQSKIDNSLATVDAKGPPSTALEAIAVARARYYSGGEKADALFEPAITNLAGGTKAGAGVSAIEAGARVESSTLSADDASRAAWWWHVAADEAELIGTRGVARQYKLRSEQYTQR